MDTKSGELVDFYSEPGDPTPPNLNPLEYGQVVVVEGIGHFEICKIDVQKQRLVLKPIPSPLSGSDECTCNAGGRPHRWSCPVYDELPERLREET